VIKESLQYGYAFRDRVGLTSGVAVVLYQKNLVTVVEVEMIHAVGFAYAFTLVSSRARIV
jgi:hypothetical protein